MADVLRLGKRPLMWSCRPAAGPAWNARHRRVVRFWIDGDGVDEEMLDSLRRREPAVSEPSLEEWRAQLRDERVIADRHLRTVLDSYHEPAWRREHKGYGRYPEDHLWFAAQGLREIDDALGD
ncbi:hypothetical protein WCD58_28470 [Actinomycetospora sp. OC33-EN07]|uniref:DUF7711 domain-containing protein n=1 Tax=Actinomycetospora flava TaxID=3129232 RepID=A0ABU8MCP6_9PSEU